MITASIVFLAPLAQHHLRFNVGSQSIKLWIFGLFFLLFFASCIQNRLESLQKRGYYRSDDPPWMNHYGGNGDFAGPRVEWKPVYNSSRHSFSIRFPFHLLINLPPLRCVSVTSLRRAVDLQLLVCSSLPPTIACRSCFHHDGTRHVSVPCSFRGLLSGNKIKG